MALGWAIVGIGHFADKFLAPALNKAVGGQLVAVYSRDLGRAESFARKHGALRGYDSLDGLLAAPDVHVVLIATPNNLHASQTIQAARAGKHVLCEKPLALTLAEGREMVAACAAAGVKLGVGFHLRHHPAHQEARRLIRSGELGEVSLAWAQWCRAEGSEAGLRSWRWDPDVAKLGSLNHGVHSLDLLRFLVGQEVVEVTAFADITPVQPMDHQTAILLRFDRGAMGMVATSERTPNPRNNVIVYGTRASIFGSGTIGTRLQGDLEVVWQDRVARHAYLSGDMYQREIEAFSRAITEDAEPNASGHDGLRAVEVVEAALESAREGRTVRLG